MQEKYQKRYGTVMILFLIALLLVMISISIRGSKNKTVHQKVNTNGSITEEAKEYDTVITGVVKKVNMGLQTITLYNIANDLEITLTYTGGTNVISENEAIMSMSEINLGDVVDAYFLSASSKLIKMQISPNAWEYKEINNFKINESDQQIQIGSKRYQYNNQIAIFNNEKEIGFMDIDKQDLVNIKGVGQSVYSITIAKGHGYIRFSGYKDFIGGTVEVGNDIFLPVTNDMVIIAREGSYRLTLENQDLRGIKYITVSRDKEITIDMSEYRKEAEQSVSVEFNISPEGADLYINNVETEYNQPVELPFGEYEIQVTARGYTDYTGTLIIGEDSKAYEKVAIDLVEAVETKTPESTTIAATVLPSSSAHVGVTVAPTPTVSPQATTNTDSDHVISIRTPIGAQVYINGVYKGQVPVSFEKQIGTLSILLSQSGYQTKSYTVQVKDDSEDAVYQFSDMVPAGE